MSGRVFVDAGSLFGINQARPLIAPGSTAAAPVIDTYIDSSALRLSSGIGVSWKSPLGPVKIDFGIPILKEPFDQRQLINVNFGTKF